MVKHQDLTSLLVIFSLLIFSSVGKALPSTPHKDSPPAQPIIFELEFINNAELYKTANFLRANGIAATVVTEPKEMIIIEAESYNKALEKLSHLVPNLPDIQKFTWKNGDLETTLYEMREANIFLKAEELTENTKVLKDYNKMARMTLVLKEDKKNIIKYENTVRKVESLGFNVTFADGYMDAGWTEYPAIDIVISNNIISFTRTLLKLSELPEINRFIYNPGKNPHINDYILTFKSESTIEFTIARLLANGIEVYKVDKLLNRIFIHFPISEERNKIKLEQIKMLEDLVIIKNIHENQEQFKDNEYAKNVKSIWLDVSEEVLRQNWREGEYIQRLREIAKNEVVKLQGKGMVIVNYGVYNDEGEVRIPEIVFTHRDVDSPKAEEIIKEYDKNPYRVAKMREPIINTCAALFH